MYFEKNVKSYIIVEDYFFVDSIFEGLIWKVLYNSKMLVFILEKIEVFLENKNIVFFLVVCVFLFLVEIFLKGYNCCMFCFCCLL